MMDDWLAGALSVNLMGVGVGVVGSPLDQADHQRQAEIAHQCWVAYKTQGERNLIAGMQLRYPDWFIPVSEWEKIA